METNLSLDDIGGSLFIKPIDLWLLDTLLGIHIEDNIWSTSLSALLADWIELLAVLAWDTLAGGGIHEAVDAWLAAVELFVEGLVGWALLVGNALVQQWAVHLSAGVALRWGCALVYQLVEE